MKCLIFIAISVGVLLTVNLPLSEGKRNGILEIPIAKTGKAAHQRILAAPDHLNIKKNNYMPDGLKKLTAEKLDDRSDSSDASSASVSDSSDDSSEGSGSSEEGFMESITRQLLSATSDHFKVREKEFMPVQNKKRTAENLDDRSDSSDASSASVSDSSSDSEGSGSSEEGFGEYIAKQLLSAGSHPFKVQEKEFMPLERKRRNAEKLDDRSDSSDASSASVSDSSEGSGSSEESYGEIQRTFGGQNAKRNAYPHQAALSLMFITGGTSWCGGSIISDSYILTAAHCLDNVAAATIMMGAYDRLDNAESGRVTQTVRSGNFIVHRGWQSSLMRNDIALIRLNNKIQFTNSIQAISLPSQFDIAEGKSAIISGWGHYDNSKKLSRYLRHAQSRIIDLSYCKQYFNQYITASNICLDGSAGQGTCHGDSGGPLIIQSSNGKAVLMGLTSFGSGTGCDKRWPTVFTRVSSYVSWIQQYARTAIV